MAKKLLLNDASVAHMVQARDLLMGGELAAALAKIEPVAAAGNNTAALMLAQVRAFQGDWSASRALCLQLLNQPFALCQYRDGQDVMKLFALATKESGDWKEAKKSIEAVRTHLESILDMMAENNSFAESFNRFEAYIWSEGKGQPPFKVSSPLIFAAMGEEQYARLISVSAPEKSKSNENKKESITFADLDERSKHDFYLWKALYDEDLDKALNLYEAEEKSGGFVLSLIQATLIAQLLMTFKQEERAWDILKAQITKWTPQHTFQIAPVDLLWDEKMRPLMSEARCRELLSLPRATEWLKQQPQENAKTAIELNIATTTEMAYDRERITHICSLARCLTESAVADLENQLEASPDNLDLRIMLIGAYSKYVVKNIDLKKPHITWLITHFPDSQMIEDLISYLFLDKSTNAEDFEDFKEQWLEVLEAHPENTRVLFNASLLLGADDGALAEELLTRAQSIDAGNIKLAERLYEMNAFHVHQTRGPQRILCAREALHQIAIIESLDQGKDFSKLRDLRRRAWFSLESGEYDESARLTEEMVQIARLEKIEDKYLFLQEVLKGRLALKIGETASAIWHLNNVLVMEPGRHFRPDYPHLTLAAELLAAGEQEAVLDFLQKMQTLAMPEEDVTMLEKFSAEVAEIAALNSESAEPWYPAVRL